MKILKDIVITKGKGQEKSRSRERSFRHQIQPVAHTPAIAYNEVENIQNISMKYLCDERCNISYLQTFS